jgi:tetratricopeptide (TPR) repeat protein
MKWMNRAIALAGLLTLSSVAAWAQTPECTEEFKTTKYTEWFDKRQNDQDAAYKAAKEYLAACPVEGDQYAAALKKFVDAYDKIHGNQKLAADFQTAVSSKNYAEQIRLGKQLAASNPDNAVIYIIMAGAGLGDPNQLGEASQAAKKAIELVEGGKPFVPAYQTKDQALAAMNYVIAKSLMKTPTEAIPYFVKALRFESDLKKSPLVYNELATAYGEGPVDKYAKDYKAAADAGKSVDSPEVKLIVANLNQAIDGQIDAFARAAAVSTVAADKKAIMDVLAAVYKDRNKAEATPDQLNTLVAGVLSKPIPDAPTPITTLPASSSSPTPGTPGSSSGSGAPVSAGTTTSNAAKPASSPATNSGNGAAGAPAKPTSTPKPKPRRANHRTR